MKTFGRLEALESRCLFAGNVSATLDQGLLFLQSDADGNNIEVALIRQGGRKVVLLTGKDGTTINGQSQLTLQPSRVTQLLSDLRGKGDVVLLKGLRLSDGAEIKASQDTYTLDGVTIGGAPGAQFRYQAGPSQTGATPAGPGALIIRRSDLRVAANLTGSAATETVTLDQSRFRQDFTYNGQGGGDVVKLGRSVFNKARTVMNATVDASVTRTFDFANGRQGFKALFSDYSSLTTDVKPTGGLRTIPSSAGGGTGFLLGGTNRSDDMLMFITRQLTRADGISADTSYTISFKIELASNAPSNAIGIGGSPGESVFLKAGATTDTPKVRLDRTDTTFRANFDHGQQAQSGTDMSSAGNIATGVELGDNQTQVPYKLLTFEHTHTASVRSDPKGNLHVVVGTESGFEGRTEVYIKSVTVTLTPT